MDASSNSNLNNDNVIALDKTTAIIIDNPNRKKRVPNIKSLCRNPKCEGLCKGIIEAGIVSGVVYDHIPVTPEDPTNGWVKLHNNMCNQGNGTFRHY